MKIIFEHEGRKTTVIGADYDSIVDKIRSIFPDQNHKSIQFYDTELTDYFEFTSYEQIKDLPNGTKMNFDTTHASSLIVVNDSPALSLNNDKNDEKNNQVTKKVCQRRIRRKEQIKDDEENREPIVLPTYSDLIIQGLQSSDSFPAIKRDFLDLTCAHFLKQYSDSSSKSLHNAFVLALVEKYPSLRHLDKDMGKTAHAIISGLISRKKRNIKYSKSHPTPKRSRLSIIDSNFNETTNEQIVVEKTATTEAEIDTITEVENNPLFIDPLDESSIKDLHELLDESNITETPVAASSPNISKQVTVRPPPPRTPIRLPTNSKNIRQATISFVPTPNPPVVNFSSINTNSIVIKPPPTTTTPSAIIYHDGRMHLTSIQSQPIVAVHRAILPRDTMKKQKQNEINNSIDATTIDNTESQTVLKPIFIDNIQQLQKSTGQEEVWYPKLSKSEESAYNKDVARLRSIVKPKGRSAHHISVGEIHALLRNSHRIRRRMLSQNHQDADFPTKVLQYQELFHEEAVACEYSLLKNRLCSFEELQIEARRALDDIIEKYSIQKQHQMSETDFMAIKLLCDDFGEQSMFFKNGLTDPHPILGVLMIPSVDKAFDKVFIFIRNLPYKMPVSIGAGGLHKIVALVFAIYSILDHSPHQKLLQILFEQCKQKFNDKTV